MKRKLSAQLDRLSPEDLRTLIQLKEQKATQLAALMETNAKIEVLLNKVTTPKVLNTTVATQ